MTKTKSTAIILACIIAFVLCIGTITIQDTSAKKATGKDVVKYAQKYVNKIPYKMGGKSLKNGCDCSGFTLAVYKHFGYKLPYGVINQKKCKITKLITNSSKQLYKAKQGDLLIYSKPDHISIFAGKSKNGKYMQIHAASKNQGICKTPVASSLKNHKGFSIYRIIVK